MPHVLKPARAFWVVAATFFVVMSLGAMPTPLYPFYERRDHFGPLVVTVVFAAYAVGVVASLFLVGPTSDWFGRRRVLVPAIFLNVVSATVFILWPALAGLIVARVLSGVAVGAVTGTATAYLSDLDAATRGGPPSRRTQLVATAVNLGGLGSGALFAGLLAQYFSAPLVRPYVVVGSLAVLAGLAMLLVPETSRSPERPRYAPQRVAVPEEQRSRYFAAATGAFIAFAVFGLFTSLAPSFLAKTLGDRSPALAGAVAFLAFAAGALGQSVLVRQKVRELTLIASALLVAGLAVVTISVWVPNLAAFLVGGFIAGAGAGIWLKGAIGAAIELAPKHKTAESVGGMFLAAYLGLSVPIIGLGVATQYLSDEVALLGFVSVLLVGVAFAARILLRSEAA